MTTWEVLAAVFIAVLVPIGTGLVAAAILASSSTGFETFDAHDGKFDLSVGQLQKIYDWRIGQYSNIANALFGALAAFIGSYALEKYKNTNLHIDEAFFVGLGSTLCLSILFQLKLRVLRSSYYHGYQYLRQLSGGRLINV
jgi:hypothetical protein